MRILRFQTIKLSANSKVTQTINIRVKLQRQCMHAQSPGEVNSNPLQDSCPENSMYRGAWWATVHGLQRVRQDWMTNTSMLSHIWLSVTLWPVAHQISLSMWYTLARILEWVAILSSKGSSWSGDQTHISCICDIGRWILYHWTTRETQHVFTLSH